MNRLSILPLLMFFTASTLAHTKPNIVLIVADYMGYADIEPYGSTDIKTPSLNQLAVEGTKFTNHYAAASVCIPSRASLLSGLYPNKALQGFKSSRGRGLHASNNHLLAKLKSSDYKTAIIGKWHLGSEPQFHPNDHGFDYYYGFDSWTLNYHNHLTSDGKPGLYRNKQLVTDSTGYLTDLFSQEAVSFIKRSSDKPFFLYLSYNAGLPPYHKPGLDESKWHTGWEAQNAKRGDYAAMIERMDWGIGQVQQTLKRLSLDDNTIVIFTYDHGGRHLVNSGELFHGFGTLWEGGIRVPLLVRWPNKFKANSIINSPTIAMDITSTLIQAVNNNNKTSKIDGSNLINVIDKPSEYKNRNLYWSSRNMSAIRRGKWKYVVDNHSQFLFDIESDKGERENLFYQHPNVVKQLKFDLDLWLKGN